MGPAFRPRLVGDQGTFTLVAGDNVLGRDESVEVVLDVPGISRRHARIRVTEREATLEDLDSKNGTFVGEQRVAGPRLLREGDPVRLGKRTRLVYETGSGEATETEGE